MRLWKVANTQLAAFEFRTGAKESRLTSSDLLEEDFLGYSSTESHTNPVDELFGCEKEAFLWHVLCISESTDTYPRQDTSQHVLLAACLQRYATTTYL